MKVSDYIARTLKNENINCVFGFQGGSVIHLIDSLHKNDVRFVQNYHEQASAFSAEGYARVTQNIGAAIATNGPGATNLVTGIASAYYDSVPLIYITGQVPVKGIKQDKELRQKNFQETDIISIVKSITKYAETVMEPQMVRCCLQKAIYVAKSGRPGPVLIDIPMDVQWSEIDLELAPEYKMETSVHSDIEEKVIEVIKNLQDSKRPLILVGGGIRVSGAIACFAEFMSKTKLPAVSSLMGLDCAACDKNFVGLIGSYGNRFANIALSNADFLLVLGSRLDPRQTGANTDLFAKNAKIFHVDIDKAELSKFKNSKTTKINADLREFFNVMVKHLSNEFRVSEQWLESIEKWKKKYPSFMVQIEKDRIDPNQFIHILSKKLSENSIVCADVGQNQMWVAQSLCLKNNSRLLNSGGMGAMGFALSCAIGAYFANRDCSIIAIMGDGGFQMNIQELQTIVKENIPIKMFVMNNNALGMIREAQETYLDAKYIGSIEGYSNPDFSRIAFAYEIGYTKISSYDDLDIDSDLNSKVPHLFEVDLKTKITYVYPRPSLGRGLDDQEPLLSREEYNSNFLID